MKVIIPMLLIKGISDLFESQKLSSWSAPAVSNPIDHLLKKLIVRILSKTRLRFVGQKSQTPDRIFACFVTC